MMGLLLILLLYNKNKSPFLLIFIFKVYAQPGFFIV